MNSAGLLLPATHFIRTNYLESKVVCISRYFVLLETALVVDVFLEENLVHACGKYMLKTA